MDVKHHPILNQPYNPQNGLKTSPYVYCIFLNTQYFQARFSTTGFFIFLMVMMSLSLIAFILLHYLPYTKSERVGTSPSSSANFSDALEVAHQDEQANDSDDSSDQSVHSDDSNESNDHRDDKQLNIQPQHSRFDIYQESSIKVSAIMHSRKYVVEAKN